MHIKNNFFKKSQSNMTFIIIAMIIFTVAFLIYVNFLRSGTNEASKVSSLFDKDKQCLAITKGYDMRRISYVDIDSDKRSDHCDICVCKSGCKNDIDSDKDGIPSGCDIDDSDDSVGLCDISKSGINGCNEGRSCGPFANGNYTEKTDFPVCKITS